MNTKSGEVLIAGALIGLVCGLIGMWVDASGRAQAKANLSGMEVSVMDEVAEEPGRAAIWTLGGAGAGAGIGARGPSTRSRLARAGEPSEGGASTSTPTEEHEDSKKCAGDR